MSAGTYADLLRALGHNESGNNYGFVSSLGYLGRFQFGEEALQAVGFYQGDSNPWAIDFVGSWTEKAHGLGVWDKASFLANPAAQDAAFEAWVGKIWQDAANLGLQEWIGKTVAGITVTPSGLIAGAHLVGVWATKRFLETGGGDDTRDGYGTPVSQYMSKFGGYDTPFGGGGSTTSTAPAVSGSDVINGSGAGEVLNGGEGNDTIYGNGGLDTLRGDAGDDVLKGGDQFDDMHGGIGSDTLYGGSEGDWVVGGAGEDQLFGEDGADVVLGNLGNDTVDGGEGNDVVRGGQGDDIIRGGGGSDYLAGDRGADTISGGAGADTFHVHGASGLDLVVDFNAWEGDRVNVLGGYSVYQSGSDTVVDLGGDNRMVLQNVQLSGLPDGWLFS